MALTDLIGKNGQGQAWLRTLVLGAVMAGGYYDIKSDIRSLQEQALNNFERRLALLETWQKELADRQAARIPIFDRMVITVDRLEERVDGLERGPR